jgi:hypothetical protein
MNKIVVLVILVAIFIGIYFYIKSKTPPTPAPTLSDKQKDYIEKSILKSLETPAPTDSDGDLIKKIDTSTTTMYPLTEMAMKISFSPSSNFTRGSMSTFSRMLSSAISSSPALTNILKKMTDDGKKNTGKYDLAFLDCFVLYTNTFSTPYTRATGDQFRDEYDVIASYLAFHLEEYLANETIFKQCNYYEFTKEVYIPKPAIDRILEITQRSTMNDAKLGMGFAMPAKLDLFVDRVGRYVYSDYANRQNSNGMWATMKASCGV